MYFQFDKDAVDGVFCIGIASWAVLLWSHLLVPGAHLTSTPDHCNTVDLPGMPVVNFEQVNCSCKGGGYMLLRSYVSTPNQDVNDNSEDNANDCTDLYSITLLIRGSTYCDNYQTNLKKVQTIIRKKDDASVELIPESDNPRNANAICIKAEICVAIHELGYVSLAKIPKVRMALRNKDIVKVTMKQVTSWYVKNFHEMETE